MSDLHPERAADKVAANGSSAQLAPLPHSPVSPCMSVRVLFAGVFTSKLVENEARATAIGVIAGAAIVLREKSSILGAAQMDTSRCRCGSSYACLSQSKALLHYTAPVVPLSPQVSSRSVHSMFRMMPYVKSGRERSMIRVDGVDVAAKQNSDSLRNDNAPREQSAQKDVIAGEAHIPSDYYETNGTRRSHMCVRSEKSAQKGFITGEAHISSGHDETNSTHMNGARVPVLSEVVENELARKRFGSIGGIAYAPGRTLLFDAMWSAVASSWAMVCQVFADGLTNP